MIKEKGPVQNKALYMLLGGQTIAYVCACLCVFHWLNYIIYESEAMKLFSML